jgi:hypothetical protein
MNTMIRLSIIILVLIFAEVSSSEDYTTWRCDHDGKEYVSDIPSFKIIKNGVIFDESFYENLQAVCKVEKKGMISVTHYDGASQKLIESYSNELNKCGWEVLLQEEIADESLF